MCYSDDFIEEDACENCKEEEALYEVLINDYLHMNVCPSCRTSLEEHVGYEVVELRVYS